MKEQTMNEQPCRQPICPRCDSLQILYRKRRRQYWCRRCGWAGRNVDWYEPYEAAEAARARQSDERGARQGKG